MAALSISVTTSFVNSAKSSRIVPPIIRDGQRISGGADVIQQYLNLGVLDELEVSLAPVFFGGGRRLFENLSEPGPQFRIDKVLDGSAATHLRYVRQ